MIANIITGIRVVCSIALMFCSVLTTSFYTLYVIAGLTDMIDGWIARRTNTVSEFGAKWDSVADFIFVAVCLVKLIPVMALPLWLYVWIGIIACIKCFNMGYEYVMKKRFVTVHSMANKVTGFLLFLFPLTWSFMDKRYSAVVVCLAATVAAIHELSIIRKTSCDLYYKKLSL